MFKKGRLFWKKESHDGLGFMIYIKSAADCKPQISRNAIRNWPAGCSQKETLGGVFFPTVALLPAFLPGGIFR
jgi:hypothetical protein